MPSSPRARDPQARRVRAEAILDAAAELLERYGYQKTTIDDVAREAAIGKGTIYLHWRTREQLFQAVLQRDVLDMTEKMIADIQADPSLVLLHRLTRYSFDEASRRPLLHAVLTGDVEVLGSLAKNSDGPLDRQRDEVAKEQIRVLIDNGLLDQGLEVGDVYFAYRSICLGFFLSDTLSPRPGTMPTDRMLDLVELSIQRTFGPTAQASPDAIAAAAPQVIDLYRRLVAQTREHLSRAYE